MIPAADVVQPWWIPGTGGSPPALGQPVTTLYDALRATARSRPDATALVCDGRRVTYRELAEATARVATGLRAAGVMNGDRVVIQLDNSIEAVIAIFGALAAQAVFCLVHPSVKAEKLALILAETRPAALVARADPPGHDVVREAIVTANVPLVVRVGAASASPDPDERAVVWDTLLTTAPVDPPGEVSEAALASILFTSGTTGRPKGVVSAHSDMLFAARSIGTYLGNTADDVVFSSLPLSHTYGLYQVLTSVLVGACVVLVRNLAFPTSAVDLMAREQVTGFAGVPALFASLLRLETFTGHHLPSVRYLTNASAQLPVERVSAIQRAFPGADFFSMYGQTECKRGCYLPPAEVERRPGSVGIPIPGTAARVVDDAGRDVPAGVPGELVLYGPHLMQGYWQRPDETAARLRLDPERNETALHTGDVFLRDEEGFLYFVARSDDLITCGGEKVSPHEIEDALRRMPGVLDVAALGVPDEMLGQAVKVVVVPAEGARLTQRDVRAFCSRHLEASLVPRDVEFREELPTTETGKPMRRGLVACAG